MALTKITEKGIKDGEIINADINASAAIAKSKIETFVNNNADNKVITGSGTANTLEGEANLTYDGTKLNLAGSNEADLLQLNTGNTAGNTFASIRGDNEAGIRIRGGGSQRGGEIELGGGTRNSEPAVIKFSTTTGSSLTERARINASGQILSGMTSANVGDANAIFAGGGTAGSNNYGKIYLSAAETNPAAGTALSFIGTSRNDVSNNAMAFIGVHSDGQHASNDYPTRFGFFTTADGASGATERLRIHNSGEVTIPAGITLGTAVTSKAASQTLDDYEEGTWTPVFVGASGSIGSITYSMQSGFYRKIGSLVYIEGVLRGQVTNNSTGTYDLGGLPFTVNSSSNGSAFMCFNQASWNRAPHYFNAMGGYTLARAREGINFGAATYTNGASDAFSASSTSSNRVYFTGCYIT